MLGRALPAAGNPQGAQTLGSGWPARRAHLPLIRARALTAPTLGHRALGWLLTVQSRRQSPRSSRQCLLRRGLLRRRQRPAGCADAAFAADVLQALAGTPLAMKAICVAAWSSGAAVIP